MLRFSVGTTPAYRRHLWNPLSNRRPLYCSRISAWSCIIISWGTYERLLEELSDQSAPRLLYNQGTLHLISPSYEHGVLVDIISDLLKRLVEESDLEIVGFTPVTFKREDIERDFEADAGFFIQNAARMVGKKTLNLSVEPPPDLILEVDLTVDSSENLPIYGSFGIPEVWLHDGRRMSFYAWTGQKISNHRLQRYVPVAII